MSTVNTNDSRTRNAQNLIDSFNSVDGDASAYMFIGGTSPWENEDEPPTPVNNKQEYYSVHDEMLSLKRINDIDVKYMFPNVRWVSGTTFDIYRHDYSNNQRAHSGAGNLYDAIYYTLSQNNYVYVCLNNDNDSASLVEPQNISDAPFFTSDGYQWLKLFKIDDQTQKTFSTTNLLPITSDEVHKGVEGAIYSVIIRSPGAEYTNNPNGASSNVPFYYCNIVGDGVGAVAKVRIDNNEIIKVEVVRPGKGYTFAKLDFTAGRVYEGLPQLDEKRNGLNPEGDGTFISDVIISPPGGWGYVADNDLDIAENDKLAVQRLATQMSSRIVGVFSSFKSRDLDMYPDTTFRQVGILSDVEYRREDLKNSDTLTAVYAVKFDDSEMADFEVGELIKQETFNELLEDVTAYAKVVSWDKRERILRYVQNKDTTDEQGRVTPISGPNQIEGLTSGTIGIVDKVYSLSSGGVLFRLGHAEPELIKNRGYLVYLANIKPIQRESTQTERISLFISF